MVGFLLVIINYFWGLFKLWINTIFVIPFKTTDMLWLLVPVWLAWFFAEFFQEKQGTSIGNAISNAVVILWGSIDCTRQTVKLIAARAISGFGNIFPRFFIVALVFIYGVIIVILGWKGNKLIKYIGRIREVTYVFAIFTPIFYNATPLSLNHIIAAILFFPLFYFAIELLDRYTPNPKSIVEDMKGEDKESSTSPFPNPFASAANTPRTGYQQTNYSSSSGSSTGQATNYPRTQPYRQQPPNQYNPYNQPRR